MGHCLRFVLLSLVALIALAAGGAAARAADTICNGSLTGTIDGNLVVPSGASCLLYQARIGGNVLVSQNASLIVQGEEEWTSISGNVEAQGCGSALLEGAVTVGGNVLIQNCTSSSGFAGPGVEISGNFLCQNNQAPCQATLGKVGGNVEIQNNRATSAGDISLNVIGGNLQCQGNAPAPTHELGGEWVGKNLQGQCATNLGFAAAPYACSALAGLSLPDTTISLAQVYLAGAFVTHDYIGRTVTAPVALCRVVGNINPSTNPSGDSNINFEVWLPTANWTGRYEQVGNGGAAGVIRYIAMVASMEVAAMNGNATASTDDGSSVPSGANAASFTFGHPQRINDYGYRAVHRTALDAETIVTAFYGTPPQHDYFDGCSEGGAEGLSEAQRYPDDFNGIMVGHSVSDSFLAAVLWNAQHVANPNNPAGFIPSGLLPTITNAVQNACVTAKTVPGDNFLGNPTQCNFDPQSLAPALGPGQIASLAAIYNGPATSAGVSVGPGYEPGNEAQLWPYLAGQLTQVLPGTITEATLTTPPTTDDFTSGTFVLEAFLFQAAPPNFNALTYFDVDTTPAQVFAVPIVPPSPDSAVQTVGSAVNNHSNPNLAPFRARGGKLIHYHGWADPLVQPLYSVNYYNSVVALAQQSRQDYQSALAETQSYYRLFMVPGMGHCTLGPGPVLFGANGGAGPASSDMFSALEAWVEQGTAPAQVIGHDTLNSFTRPLCPYPQNAVYVGTGSTSDAANFVCR